ncbi:hypothetical protein IF2G_09399 [Cordyceps javanica]|nr:hypothetical protein IF2G_09399 [Cordyceps javanica]
MLIQCQVQILSSQHVNQALPFLILSPATPYTLARTFGRKKVFREGKQYGEPYSAEAVKQIGFRMFLLPYADYRQPAATPIGIRTHIVRPRAGQYRKHKGNRSADIPLADKRLYCTGDQKQGSAYASVVADASSGHPVLQSNHEVPSPEGMHTWSLIYFPGCRISFRSNRTKSRYL